MSIRAELQLRQVEQWCDPSVRMILRVLVTLAGQAAPPLRHKSVSAFPPHAGADQRVTSEIGLPLHGVAPKSRSRTMNLSPMFQEQLRAGDIFLMYWGICRTYPEVLERSARTVHEAQSQNAKD